LAFLAVLGVLGARAGGAEVLKPTLRVTFWGAFAMALTAGIGALVGKAVQWKLVADVSEVRIPFGRAISFAISRIGWAECVLGCTPPLVVTTTCSAMPSSSAPTKTAKCPSPRSPRAFTPKACRRQSELVTAMTEWFHARDDDFVSDERTIRRNVSVVWRKLVADGAVSP
jgi:hypothetical protein